MTTEKPHDHDDDCGCQPPPGDPQCDPKLIDEVTCNAKGVAAQAEYNAKYQADLAKAKADYDTTRKAYRQARHDAGLTVQDLRHQVKHLIERIKCLIEQDRVVRCLDEAFCVIVKELECCEVSGGCCVDECEYNPDPPKKYKKLSRRIVTYQAMADAAKACFDKLVGEPAALTARVAASSAEIEAINAALSADPASTDLKKVYAQALVAQRNLERIWNGFAQTTDFVECLCQAMMCWIRGIEVVSILIGAKAVADCKNEAAAQRCESLQTSTVDEILAEYDKLCPPHKPPNTEPPDDSCDDDDKPDKPDQECPPEQDDKGEGHSAD